MVLRLLTLILTGISKRCYSYRHSFWQQTQTGLTFDSNTKVVLLLYKLILAEIDTDIISTDSGRNFRRRYKKNW